ncbi:1556_t:CDS:1, partial [Racocetra fulgida]
MAMDLGIPSDIENPNDKTNPINEKNKIKVTDYTKSELKTKRKFTMITALAQYFLGLR